MSRVIISARDIQEAVRAGRKALDLPLGALVTPLAMDEARDSGLSLRPGATLALPKPDIRPENAAAAQGSEPESAISGRSGRTGSIGSTGSTGSTGRGGSTDRSGAAMAGVAQDGRTRESALHGVEAVRCPAAEEDPEDLQLREILLPGPAGPGLGMLRWKDSSFAWTFEAEEVLVVTEGTLVLSSAAARDTVVEIHRGGAVRIRAGTSLNLAARGTVSCVCASWPRAG